MGVTLIITTRKYDSQMGHGLLLEYWKSTLNRNTHGEQLAFQISLEELLTMHVDSWDIPMQKPILE